MTAAEAERPVAHGTVPEDERPPRSRPQASLGERALRILIPVAMLVHRRDRLAGLRHHRRGAALHPAEPAPHRAGAASTDWDILGRALLITLRTTFLALVLALVGGVRCRSSSSSRAGSSSRFFPYAVILQVTPIVAIAPLILIYTDTTQQALLDLRLPRRLLPGPRQHHAGAQVDRPQPPQPLRALRRQRWQTLVHLKIPNALPFFLAGLQDRRRPRADRRGGRRVRRRHRGRQCRPRLPPARIAVPAQHPAPLRGAGAAVA